MEEQIIISSKKRLIDSISISDDWEFMDIESIQVSNPKTKSMRLNNDSLSSLDSPIQILLDPQLRKESRRSYIASIQDLEDCLETDNSEVNQNGEVVDEDNEVSDTPIITASKKRGPYKKDPTKKVGKIAFLEDYVENTESIFKEWIVYDKEKDSLFCQVCIQAGSRTHNLWGDIEKGFKNFTKKDAERHNSSTTHKNAKIALEKIKKMKIDSYLEKKFSKIDQDMLLKPSWMEEYRNLFLNIFWGCRKELSIRTICDLHMHSKEILNAKIPDYHLSPKSTTKIIYFISYCIQQDLIKEALQNDYIGVLIDESKDASDKEILLLYLKFWSKHEKTIKTVFISAFHLHRKLATVIYNTIKPWLIEKGIYNKIIFLCTDAAANVSSEENGVAGLMERDLSLLLSYKCLAHAQNTALRHTYKNFSRLQIFNKKLFNIINYIDGSPKRNTILNDAQIEAGYENIMKVIRAKEIRWNSFFLATNRIRELYTAIYNALDEYKSEAKNKSEEKEIIEIKECLTDFNFVYIMNWLSDFLQPILKLNKLLQLSEYELAKIEDHVDETIYILNADYIEYPKPLLANPDNIDVPISIDTVMKHHMSFGGFRLSSFLSNCTFVNEKEIKYKLSETLETTLRYTKLEGLELKIFVVEAVKFLKTELLDIVPKRKNFFKNFLIFNLEKIKNLSKQELSTYGSKEISELADFYLQDPKYQIEKDLVTFEWSKMKRKINEEMKRDNEGKIEQIGFVSYILSNADFLTDYDGVIEIIKIYAVLPCSNAEVERGFSTMNRIKTDIRNQLSPDVLENLLMVNLNGNGEKQWYMDKVEEWMNFWYKNNNVRFINN